MSAILAWVPVGAQKRHVHTVVEIPRVEARVIPIGTEKMQILLQVDEDGKVFMPHVGAPIANPQEILRYKGGACAGHAVHRILQGLPRSGVYRKNSPDSSF